MMQTPDPKGVERYVGRDVFSSEGAKIGTAQEFLYNKLSGVAEWIIVGTGFLNSKQLVVPVAGSEFRDDGIHVPYTSEIINDEPEVDPDDGLTSEAESILSAYFGLGANDVPEVVMSEEPREA